MQGVGSLTSLLFINMSVPGPPFPKMFALLRKKFVTVNLIYKIFGDIQFVDSSFCQHNFTNKYVSPKSNVSSCEVTY